MKRVEEIARITHSPVEAARRTLGEEAVSAFPLLLRQHLGREKRSNTYDSQNPVTHLEVLQLLRVVSHLTSPSGFRPLWPFLDVQFGPSSTSPSLSPLLRPDVVDADSRQAASATATW